MSVDYCKGRYSERNSDKNTMKNYFVFFSHKFSVYEYMYKEILSLDNVKFFWGKDELLKLLNKAERFLARIHFSPKVNSIIQLSNKNIWYFRALKRLKLKLRREAGVNRETSLVFVWHYRFVKEINDGWIEYLSKVFPDSKNVFFFSDPSYLDNDLVNNLKKIMDIIYVFDPNMAEKYNISYFPNVYPYTDEQRKNENYKYDVCFIGVDKGREEIALNISRICHVKGIKSSFILCTKDKSKKDIQDLPDFQYIYQVMSYDKVLDIVKDSRCIIELAVEPYHTCSLRVQEAVIWNKKLITNNKNVDKMPCCKNSRWIHYFDKPEDIDWDFVKRNEEVDYHYKGEYSAVNWLQKMEEYFQNSG